MRAGYDAVLVGKKKIVHSLMRASQGEIAVILTNKQMRRDWLMVEAERL